MLSHNNMYLTNDETYLSSYNDSNNFDSLLRNLRLTRCPRKHLYLLSYIQFRFIIIIIKYIN